MNNSSKIISIQQHRELRIECEDIVLSRLQKKQKCDNISNIEISDAIFESIVITEMNKKQYIDNLIKTTGKKPTPIPNDPKGRYGWRVNGKGYYPRGKDEEACYDAQWQYHLKEIKKNEFSHITLQNLMDIKCEEARRFNKEINTILSWKSYTRFYLNDFLDREIGSFTKNEIVEAYTTAISKKKPCSTTVRNARNNSCMFFKYAVKELHEQLRFDIEELKTALVDNTPEEFLKTNEEIMLFKKSQKDYTAFEMKRMIEEANKRDTIKSYAAILGFFFGYRISENSGILIENIDINNGIIYIETAFMRNNETNQYDFKKPKKIRAEVIPTIALPIIKRIRAS